MLLTKFMYDVNYHEDEKIRIANERHAAIIIRDKSILTLYRIRKGITFYTIPGGHRQEGETGLETVAREIRGETGLVVSVFKKIFEFNDIIKNNFDHYYLTEYVSGVPTLGSEEALKNSPDNLYEFRWINIDKISEIDLLPKFAKGWIEQNLLEFIAKEELS